MKEACALMPEWLAGFFSIYGQQVGVLVYLAFIALNTLLNWLMLPRLRVNGTITAWPPVAVLVPARNEEANIRRCVTSLLAQDYPDFAVWVLDDDSTDGTWAILSEMRARDQRLHIGRSAPLPAGWLGKNWACHQLAAQVPERYRLLLFVDADTWHAPDMLRVSVATLLSGGYDLLSLLPRQEMHTLVEMLTVPLLPWAMLSHFPLWLTQRLPLPALAMAVGQHMLWRREAYRQVGGHAAVRGEVIEDIALARRSAGMGLRVGLLPARGKVACRMYRSAGEVLEGFGKNLFAVFNRNPGPYLFVWFWLGVAFCSPWLMLFLGLGDISGASVTLAGISLALEILIWGLVSHLAGLRIGVLVLFPLVPLVALLLSLVSLAQYLAHRARWKGRPVSKT